MRKIKSSAASRDEQALARREVLGAGLVLGTGGLLASLGLSAPVAAPAVFVGRTTEHAGRLVLMKGQGSGIIRLG